MNDARPKTDDTIVRGLSAGTFNLLCVTLLGTVAVVSTPVLAAHKSSATDFHGTTPHRARYGTLVPRATATANVRQAEGSYFVQAPVLHVEPIVTKRYVDQPVQHCTTEYPVERADDYPRQRHTHRRILPGLLGGLIGGWVGHQFGGGNGKKVLTVIGALTGSSIAKNAARQRDADTHEYERRDRRYRRAAPVQRCQTTYESRPEESINGYLVTYEYAGQTFEKRVPRHPGDEISIRVRVTPLGP